MKVSMKKLHIAVIIIGIIFISLGAFHTNIWFDESYSVAIANHSFSEIWTIGGNDVHPILYYWMLKLISLVFGESLIAYRIFGIIAVAILASLGYTHIRKDFGDKVGILFSFLVLFLPEMTLYASEIRMYTWAMLFVTLTAIYAYRLTKSSNRKNWFIFGICSLISAYMHYYGLMCSGIINAFLFCYLIFKLIKSTKNDKINRINKQNLPITTNKIDKQNLIYFIIIGILQIACYIPWLVYFTRQVSQVSKGFWIGIEFPKTLIELVNVQYVGQLNEYFAFGFAICLYIYIGILIYINKDKNNKKPAILAIIIYAIVILAAAIISALMQSVILYHRYLITITGLLVFFITYFMSKETKKYITIGICSIILIMSVINNIKFIKINYDESNGKQIEYVKERIRQNDIFIYSSIGNGAIMAVNFPENKQYFYNKDHWGVEEAYKAYAPQMETIENLDDILDGFTGRIWLVDSESSNLYDDLNDDSFKIIETKSIHTKYKDCTYNLVLVEK